MLTWFKFSFNSDSLGVVMWFDISIKSWNPTIYQTIYYFYWTESDPLVLMIKWYYMIWYPPHSDAFSEFPIKIWENVTILKEKFKTLTNDEEYTNITKNQYNWLAIYQIHKLLMKSEQDYQ